MNEKQIKHRLIFRYILVFALAGGLLCLGFRSHMYRLQAEETEYTFQSIQETAEHDLVGVQTWLAGNWSRLEELGLRLRAGSTSGASGLDDFLHTELLASPYEALALIDADGGLIDADGASAPLERWPVDLADKHTFLVLVYDSMLIFGQQFAEPVSWQGHSLVGAVAREDISQLQNSLAARDDMALFSSSLLCRNGRVLLRAAESAPDYAALFESAGDPDTDAARLLAQMEAGNTISQYISIGESDYALHLLPVEGTDWYLAVAAGSAAVNGLARALLPEMVLYLVCWLCMFAVLLLFLLRPVQRAQVAAAVRKEKTMFLTSLTQALRAPLSGIAGLHFLMQQDLDKRDSLREHLQKAERSTEYLRRFITDLLDMYKLKSGQLVLNCNAVNLTELLEEIDALTRVQAEDGQLSYGSESELVSPWICGDGLRLRQLLLHLLDNAIKFTLPDGHVQLHVTQRTRPLGRVETCFSVADTGVGMDAVVLEQFWTSSETEWPVNTQYGSGLGAPLCKTLTSRMGGHLEIKSEWGSGSTFTVRLTSKIPHVKARPSGTRPEAASIRRKHVLVVEDNAISRELVVEILQELGCSAVQAINGQEAVQIFKNSRQDGFDLILMDIQMPVMDGYRATREIRALRRPDAHSVAIVALTANIFQEEIETALRVGMDDVLAKPLALDRLLRVLRDG